MEYAQLNEAGTEAIQITTHGNVEWDENNFCSAEALTRDAKAAQFRVVPLTVTEQPTFDPMTQTCIRDGCEKVDGEWQYKWRIDDLTPEQIAANQAAFVTAKLAAFDTALTAHLDATAQTKRYDNRITCMVRAGFSGPFQAEGIAFATWCDTCNAIAYELLEEVQAGTRPLPETTQALIDELPEMVWPA